VVERRVPRGVKIIETFQRLTLTDQLEVTVRRSGGPDDGLGKVDLRRVFDRERGEAAGPAAAGSMSGPGTGGTSSVPRSATSEVDR
jgi:hypothetical protein